MGTRIAMFLDTSGGMMPSWFEVFWQRYKDLVDRGHEVLVFGFSMDAYEIDPKNPVYRGVGGTNFKAVQDVVELKLDPPPFRVVVFTDGYGQTIRPKDPERYHWLIIREGDEQYVHDLPGTYEVINIPSGGVQIIPAPEAPPLPPGFTCNDPDGLG